MKTNDKTLADAQPGGRVRLGDQLLIDKRARELLAAEYRQAGYPCESEKIIEGYWDSHPSIRAIIAALTAQPSPGGQGDATIKDAYIRHFGWECGWLGDVGFGFIEGYRAALAARQPSRQPDSVALGEATEFCIEKGERPPVGEQGEGDDFLAGICVALQCVTAQDCGVLWREIVVAVGIDDLLQYATFIEPEEWELAGFGKYASAELRRRKPRIRASKQSKAPPAQAVDLGAGVKAIAAERERQLQAEGFSRDCDQQYREGELARAATAYVQLAAMDLQVGTRSHIALQEPPFFWPWAPEWWKPVDARRDLVRAGALIAAQIDLIDSQAVGNG